MDILTINGLTTLTINGLIQEVHFEPKKTRATGSFHSQGDYDEAGSQKIWGRGQTEARPPEEPASASGRLAFCRGCRS